MAKVILTIAWTDYAMQTLFPNVPDRDPVKTFTLPLDSGNRTVGMIPAWIEYGYVETFRAETFLLTV